MTYGDDSAPGSYPGAPLIDWSGISTQLGALPPAAVGSKASAWQDDFVNQLARSADARNPNASLRIQISAAPKLSLELKTLVSHV